MDPQTDTRPALKTRHQNDMGEDRREDRREDRLGQPASETGTVTRDERAAIAETVDGSSVQVLELRGTIIRLREQLDRIHMSYEERVQQLESTHRSQRRELEETIRHLRDRLQTLTDLASGT